MNKTLEGNCESCMMPFTKDPLKEKRESEKHCSYCYRNGKFQYAGDNLREFQNAMVKAITDRGENRIKAYLFAFMASFAPRWKKGYELKA